MERSLIDFELSPKKLKRGNNDVTVKLRNMGLGDIDDARLTLKPLDINSVTISDPVKEIPCLKNGEAAMMSFRVEAAASGGFYMSIDGKRDGKSVHYDTHVEGEDTGEKAAGITGISAETGVYEPPGNKFYFKIILKGYTSSKGLMISNHVELPDGDTEVMEDIFVEELKEGEEKIITAFIVPEIEGPYTVYSYLYNGNTVIDRAAEKIFIQDTGGKADDE